MDSVCFLSLTVKMGDERRREVIGWRTHSEAVPGSQWGGGIRGCGVGGGETAEHIISRSSFCLSESLHNVKSL